MQARNFPVSWFVSATFVICVADFHRNFTVTSPRGSFGESRRNGIWAYAYTTGGLLTLLTASTTCRPILFWEHCAQSACALTLCGARDRSKRHASWKYGWNVIDLFNTTHSCSYCNCCCSSGLYCVVRTCRRSCLHRFSDLPLLRISLQPVPLQIRNKLQQLFPNGVLTRSSKRPANFQQMYLKYILDVCWKFAGSCKHPIRLPLFQFVQMPVTGSFHISHNEFISVNYLGCVKPTGIRDKHFVQFF